MLEKLNKILRYPEKIPCDKRMHMIIGLILNSFLVFLSLNIYIHVSIIIFVAWGIEYYQKWTKSGTFDHYDALAVLVGGLLPYIPMKIMGL